MAVQPNSDIVVADSFGLARYLPDGKLDTSFGAGGLAGASFAASALAIQPNGGYVVAGLEQTGPELREDDFAVARLTTSGRLDPAFGHGGVVTTAFPDAADGAGADAVLVEPGRSHLRPAIGGSAERGPSRARQSGGGQPVAEAQPNT